MRFVTTIAAALVATSTVLAQPPQATPIQRLQRDIERTTRSVNATWGIYVKSLETGDFLPYVGDDVGVLEAQGRTIILSVYTGNHFGSGEALEDAIGRVAKSVGDYFDYRR